MRRWLRADEIVLPIPREVGGGGARRSARDLHS